MPHDYDVVVMLPQIARNHGVQQVQQFGEPSPRGAVAFAVKDNV